MNRPRNFVRWTGALALVAIAAPANAQPAEGEAPQPADCPPGAFCEKEEVPAPEGVAPEGSAPQGTAPQGAAPAAQPAPAGEGRTVVLPPPPPGSDPNAPRVVVVQPNTDKGPGQVVVYEHGSAPPHLTGQPVRPIPPPPPPPKEMKRWRRHRQWGLNMRVDGVLLPRSRSDVESSGMGGIGLSLRYRPLPVFAIDVSSDFLGGTDSNGFDRQEVPFGVNAMIYPNPGDLAQFYAFGGISWSFARVFSDRIEPNLADGTSDEYSYFGGQLGVGIEFRVSRLVGINIDGLAVMRTRTDSDGGGLFPEFFDAVDREGSNTAAFGMLRGGVTFWW
jgi:hypothetical protein